LKMLFQSLYTWIAAFNSLPVSNFSPFLVFCYFSTHLLYTFCVVELHPSTLLMNLNYIKKKERKKESSYVETGAMKGFLSLYC
jgi:hypothetical protein